MRYDGEVRVVPLVGVEESGGDAVGGVAGEGRGRVEVFDCCLVFFFQLGQIGDTDGFGRILESMGVCH